VAAAVTGTDGGDGVGPDGVPWRVDVPGGTCEVRWQPDGELLLTGPAVLVADLEVDDAWLRAAAAAR
jgi:diaminopimelate epimerase